MAFTEATDEDIRKDTSMTYTQYQRRRNAAANRIALAIAAGNRAVASDDWRAMVAACREHDAAYLAFRALEQQAKDIYKDAPPHQRSAQPVER